jgi:hypothetical protein
MMLEDGLGWLGNIQIIQLQFKVRAKENSIAVIVASDAQPQTMVIRLPLHISACVPSPSVHQPPRIMHTLNDMPQTPKSRKDHL